MRKVIPLISEAQRAFMARATTAYEGRHLNPPRLLALTLVVSNDRYDVIVHGVGAEGLLVEIPGRGIFIFKYTQVNFFAPEVQS